MPRVWIPIPIGGTAPVVEPYRQRPRELERLVRDIVAAVDANLEYLYFDVHRPVAYAQVERLDDPVLMRAVCRVLGVEEAVKILDVEQAARAIERERALLEQFPPGSADGGQ